MATIEILNQDVLREIFSYLSLYERQRMGLVCKKFQNIHEIMMEPIRKIYCSYVPRSYGRSVDMIGNVLNIKTYNPADLNQPLKKFAKHLKKIQIMHKTYEKRVPNIYKSLAKCKKLKYAQLECTQSKSLVHFLESLPTDNLKDLSIKLCDTCGKTSRTRINHMIEEVLLKTTKLKSLKLYFVPVSKLSTIFGGMGTLKTLILKIDKLRHSSFDKTKLQNLENLYIFCDSMKNHTDIIELIRNSRKLHSIRFEASNVLPETILNEIISLPNLRRLHLLTLFNSYDSWHKFSNLEEIQILQANRFLSTRDEIESFLERSKNLKRYNFDSDMQLFEFNKLVHQIASDIGHKCKEHRATKFSGWHKKIPF